MISALVGHLVGDYLLQNDWMALNKKDRFWPCFIHSFIWATCICVFAWWGRIPQSWFSLGYVHVHGLLCFTHFIIDYSHFVSKYMDFIGQNKFRTGLCAPWSTIVVDNVWHILTIWIIWKFVIPNI